MGFAPTWRKRLAVAALVAVAAMGGAATAGASGDANQGSPVPRAGAASPSESVFVPITPCRIVNTQNGAGKIGVQQVRQYRMHGNTSAQGGAASCGIPETASALEISVTAVLANGSGYLRIYPSGQPEANATFLNYGSAQNITNAGTVAVAPGGGNNFQVKAFQQPTHVIVDALGYYVKGLHAVINGGNGTAARSNGVVSTQRTGLGQYRISFDRNVSGCAFAASIGLPVDGTPLTGQITATPSNTDANGVYVTTQNSDGVQADRPFHLTVTC